MRMRWTCASSPLGAATASCRCLRFAALTSKGFARDLQARGRARATVTRRLCTIAGFYRYAVEAESVRLSCEEVQSGRSGTDNTAHATTVAVVFSGMVALMAGGGGMRRSACRNGLSGAMLVAAFGRPAVPDRVPEFWAVPGAAMVLPAALRVSGSRATHGGRSGGAPLATCLTRSLGVV
jgi:hypothetical protein